jgi:hypothetical protein
MGASAKFIDCPWIWLRNVSWIGGTCKTITNLAALHHINMMLGNTANGGLVFSSGYHYIGNTLTGAQITGDVGGTTLEQADGLIYANNRLISNVGDMKLGQKQSNNYNRGFAVVQNTNEILSNGTLTILFNISADGINNKIGESIDIYNTILGNRGNWLYSDNSGSPGWEKRGISRYSIWYSKPKKTDTFAVTSGSTGDWEWQYFVGSTGMVNLSGAATEQGTLATSGVDPSGGPNGGTFTQGKVSGMYIDANSYVGSGSGGYATVTFVNDQCGMVGTGPGGGDYHLTGTGPGDGGSGDKAVNNAYARVPSGMAMLKYDLGGAARKNDGRGAAGAYERTDV